MPVWLHHPVCISFSGSENRKKVILDFVVSPHFSLSFFTTIYIFSLSLSLYLPFCSLIISYFVFRISWYLIRLLMFYYFFMLLIEIVSEWTEWMSLGNYFIIPPPSFLSPLTSTHIRVYILYFSAYIHFWIILQTPVETIFRNLCEKSEELSQEHSVRR